MGKTPKNRANLGRSALDVPRMLKRYSEKVSVHAERNRRVRMLSEKRLRCGV